MMGVIGIVDGQWRGIDRVKQALKERIALCCGAVQRTAATPPLLLCGRSDWGRRPHVFRRQAPVCKRVAAARCCRP